MPSQKQVHGRIVVGVDGSTASRQAVLWAAAEARIRHGDLIITHVQPAVPNAGATQDDADLDRHLMLAASAAAASTRQPGVAVGTLLIEGDISDQLVQFTQSAAMLVVGVDRTMSRAAHGAIGPIEDRVVAHAWCPVVIVSEGRRGIDVPYGSIVVGLTADCDTVETLDAAAEEAVVRKAALTVVVGQANWLESDPAGSSPVDASSIDVALEALSRTHPELTVTVTRREAGELLGQELERESMSADLMIVGCAKSEDRWSIRTGALSAEMIREAHCPVMLVGRRVERRAGAAMTAA